MRNIYVDTERGSGSAIFTVCYDDHITSFKGGLIDLVAFIEAIGVSKQDNLYVVPFGIGMGSYFILEEYGYNVIKPKHHNVHFMNMEKRCAILS